MKSNSLVIIRFELIFVCGRSRVPLHCFACGYPVVPAPFVEEAIFSPFSGLGTLVKNQLTIGISLAVQWLGLLLFIQTLESVCPHFDWDCFQPIDHFKKN